MLMMTGDSSEFVAGTALLCIHVPYWPRQQMFAVFRDHFLSFGGWVYKKCLSGFSDTALVYIPAADKTSVCTFF